MENHLKLILNYPELVEKLSSKGVSIVASPQEDKTLFGILLSVSNAFTYWCMDILYVKCKGKEVRWGLESKAN